MAKKEEEIKVGLVVVVAVTLFLTALVAVGGVNLFRKKRVAYTTYFKFAGGLEPGAFVRFGGLKVGVVQLAEIDPHDTTRVRVKIAVNEKTPIRQNSRAKVSTLGPLGENYLEISPGTSEAGLLAPGGEIPTDETVQMADILNNVNAATLNANTLIKHVDERVVVIADKTEELVTNFNSVVNAENRRRIDSVLANIDAILAENRAPLKSAIANVDTTSAKLGPTIDNANQTITSTKKLADNLDATLAENRKEINEALTNLRKALIETRALMSDVQNTLDSNRANLDETLENIRTSSQNLKEFTDQVKRQPFSLIRIKPPKDRQPPGGK
jgi:phospholipid/cholesterol/gamma-HCH transport system substrate-binding protein